MLEHPSVWMYLPTVFGSMYIATTKNSLTNNKNINVVGNKKIAGAVDFKIDPLGNEQKNLSLYSLELMLYTLYLILPGNDA